MKDTVVIDFNLPHPGTLTVKVYEDVINGGFNTAVIFKPYKRMCCGDTYDDSEATLVRVGGEAGEFALSGSHDYPAMVSIVELGKGG